MDPIFEAYQQINEGNKSYFNSGKKYKVVKDFSAENDTSPGTGEFPKGTTITVTSIKHIKSLKKFEIRFKPEYPKDLGEPTHANYVEYEDVLKNFIK